MKFSYRLKRQYYGVHRHFLNYKVFVRGTYVGEAPNIESALRLVIKALKKELTAPATGDL